MSTSPLIVGLGEVLWDLFPDRRRPGGAPANIAYHATRLGNRGVVVSRVGADADGAALRTFLADKGMETRYLQTDPTHPTGTVAVAFTDGEPHYTVAPDVAWDHLAFTDALQALATEADALCFQTLAQRAPRSRATIQAALDAAAPATLRVLDVNLRAPFYTAETLHAAFQRADLVKLSRSELATVRTLLGQPDPVAWLLQELGVGLVCITHGADGAEVFSKDTHHHRAGTPVDTSQGDPVGVGDAFLAAMTHGLVRHHGLDDALDFANRYAGLIATYPGAMPPLPADRLDSLVRS